MRCKTDKKIFERRMLKNSIGRVLYICLTVWSSNVSHEVISYQQNVWCVCVCVHRMVHFGIGFIVTSQILGIQTDIHIWIKSHQNSVGMPKTYVRVHHFSSITAFQLRFWRCLRRISLFKTHTHTHTLQRTNYVLYSFVFKEQKMFHRFFKCDECVLGRSENIWWNDVRKNVIK